MNDIMRPATEWELKSMMSALVERGVPVEILGAGSKRGVGRPVGAPVALTTGAMRGISLGDSLYDGAADVGAALAKAGEIEDPRLRDVVREQIGQRHKEAGIAAEDRERRAYDTAWETLENGGRVVDLPDAASRRPAARAPARPPRAPGFRGCRCGLGRRSRGR